MHTDFRLGDWIVRPRRGYIERGEEIVHIHPKPMAVLECLAAADGEVVTRDYLFERVWPGVIVTDDALAQCVVELRKSFGDSARDAKIIRTIPKAGYCLIPPVTTLTEAKPAPGNRLRLIALGILSVMVIMVALYMLVPGEQKPVMGVTDGDARSSIAVLPFVNRSSQPGDEYFSDGMHDELLSRLSLIPALRVISRTSVNQYRDTDKSLPEIANELSVATILEGSVQRDGKQVRINVQLIDARSDSHLWSKTYDSELVSIFAVQDEISTAIAAALKDLLGINVAAGPQISETVSTQAHDAYLRGRYLVAKRTSADIEGAVSEFERAVELDPEYAIAHAELAMALLFAGGNRYQVLPREEAISRAAEHANQAMALEPNLAEAHAAFGGLAWRHNAFDDALVAFSRALEIKPSYSDVHNWIALIFARVGRYKEVLPHQEQALRLNPLSVVAMNNYVHSLIDMSRFEEATRELEKIRSIAPGVYAEYMGRVKSAGGKWTYAVLGGLDKLRITPDDLLTKRLLSWKFLIIGLEQEALAIIDSPGPQMLLALGRPLESIAAAEALLAKGDPNIPSASNGLGMILAATGDFARARPLLEESWQQNGRQITMGVFGTENAVALFDIRLEAGDDTGATELLAAIWDNVRRLREAGYTTAPYGSTDFDEGLAAYLAGQREKGLSLIARASDDGYFIGQKTAYLKELYDDPGFAPVLASQQARQIIERNRFLSIVCVDNPYEEVWQPAAGTCEKKP